MSANLDTVTGKIRQLDGLAGPDEQVTPDQIEDKERAARLLMQILKDVASLKRRFWPKRMTFESKAVDATGTTKYRFKHGINARVRWWPVDWSGASAGPQLARHEDSDSNTLVLVSYASGTVALRIEEAG